MVNQSKNFAGNRFAFSETDFDHAPYRAFAAGCSFCKICVRLQTLGALVPASEREYQTSRLSL
jgi:hypothetical protein